MLINMGTLDSCTYNRAAEMLPFPPNFSSCLFAKRRFKRETKKEVQKCEIDLHVYC